MRLSIICLLMLCIIGCDSNKKSTKIASNDHINIKEEDISKEESTLLSIKYSIVDKTVVTILKEYDDQIVDIMLKSLKATDKSFPEPDYRKIVSMLSNKYNLSMDKIAGLIVDHDTWEKNQK